jgi:large subunit ribosomal protein L32e
METIKKALELRKKIKSKKPTFVVKESKFSARVKSRWRFPRGKHSKTRQMHRGRANLVSTGYGSPNLVKGLHSSGLEMVLIGNEKSLLLLNPKTQGAIISSTVSMKNKLKLLKSAEENKIEIVNVKDIKESIKVIEENFSARVKLKSERIKERTKKQEDKKKKAEEKKKKEEKKNTEAKSVDEIKEENDKQKEMAEKTITKKQ